MASNDTFHDGGEFNIIEGSGEYTFSKLNEKK